MRNKQLLYLFVCNFGIFFIGTGLFPILPLYASDFGASVRGIGLYLGITYVAIASGTALTGWLSERITRQRLHILSGLLGIPAVFLMGQATAFWQVVALTAIIWFCGGVGLTLSSIFTGLYAGNSRRGKSFGLMFLAFPVAMLISGGVVGWLIEAYGYPVMFRVVSLIFAIFPLAAYLRPSDAPVVSDAAAANAGVSGRSAPAQFSRPFYLLLAVSILLETSVYSSRLAMSLSMDRLNFTAGAISSTSIVSGITAILFGLMISAFSDRTGSKLFMTLGIFGAAAGVVVLSLGTQLWHFWLATALLFAGHTVNGSIIPALGSSLLHADALSHGLSRINSMTWIAGIIGFVFTGYIIDLIGMPSLFVIATTLALTSVVLTGLLPGPSGQRRLSSALGFVKARLTSGVE